MELLFDDEYYDTESFAEGKYLTDLKEDLLEFDKNLTATRGDIAHGADFPIVIIELFNEINWNSILKEGVIPTVFFLGEKINENLEAWLEISKKIKKVV